MSPHTSLLGAQGEKAAADFLRRKGYKILERNFRPRGGEIDIVALDGDEIVFVEVKALADPGFGRPEEHVTREKKRRVRKAALAYCRRHGLADPPSRCDVISVLFDENAPPQIEHFENAFPLVA